MQDAVGVDVSKDELDACHARTAHYRQFANDAAGLAALCRWDAGDDGAVAVFEGETGRELVRWTNSPSNGAYHRDLERALASQGLTFAKVNPRQARRFAEAIGRVAKTGKVDAEVLARMGVALQPAPTVPVQANGECQELCVSGRRPGSVLTALSPASG